jgi:ribose transport system substrate-binding protein
VLGQNASDFVNQKLGGKAKVLILGNDSLDVGKQRNQGLMSVFPQAAPGAKIVSTQNATTRAEGLSITSQVLSANPDVNVVLGYDDDVALGAYQALLQHGVAADAPNIYIGSQDGTQESLQTVAKNGIYRCTVAVRIRDIGHAIVDVPADLLEKKATAPKVASIAPVAITAGSPQLAEYLSDYTG